jgi:hypothetical protein
MHRFIALLAIAIFASLAFADNSSPPLMEEIKKLVERLGSQDFQEREAATKRLEEIGAPALDALRAACKSEDPETVKRAQEILRKVEKNLTNERTLAPTMVELEARDTPLDSVLAAISKQGKCEVVLGGLKTEELAQLKVTVSTGGKVSFWEAILKVCQAAELQVAVVGGFVAPGAMPYLGKPSGNVRYTRNTNQAIVLESREPNSPRRPAAVHGSVLVEAMPFPKNTSVGDSPAILLQAWPEPRLQWQATNTVRISKAIDNTGGRLLAEFRPPSSAATTSGGKEGVVLIRNADGSVTVVRDIGPGFQPAGLFAPNTHQAVISIKRGETVPEKIKELNCTLFAAIRTGNEPISTAAGLLPNQIHTGVGGSDVEMTATYETDAGGKLVATVTLEYDSKVVHPVGVADKLSGVKGVANLGPGNHTVYGILVTDKDGKPFDLGLRSGSNQLEAGGKRTVMTMTLELVPDRGGNELPATVTFWGTHERLVEVPINLKDVPVAHAK